MPRRSGSGSGFGGRSPVRSSPPPMRSSPPPMRSSSPAPMAQRAPANAGPHPTGAPASQGPGLMAQMAATAGGVAIGSAVGHTVGHMMTGGGGSGQQQEASPQQQQAGAPQQQNFQQPCEFELRQFMDCANQQTNLGFCDAFNDALKECRKRYGI